MLKLTFADNSGPLDASLAIFASDLGRLACADFDRPGTIDSHFDRAEQKKHVRRPRPTESAHHSRARVGSPRFERPTHDAITHSAKYHRKSAERPETRTGQSRVHASMAGLTSVSSRHCGTTLEGVMAHVWNNLVQLGEAAGLESAGDRSVSEDQF